jgi:hypothetical protein
MGIKGSSRGHELSIPALFSFLFTLFQTAIMTEKQVSQEIGDEKPEALHREDTIDQEKQQQAGDYSGARKKTDPAEIRLVRKLDLWIMPTLWGMYWLNYLDRNAIALARLNDLEEDLNLSSSQYQTCVSILFVGYLLGQVPSSMLPTLHALWLS